MDDWAWWTSIGGDLADSSGLTDSVWDSALTSALDPSAVVSEDLIPVDEISDEFSDDLVDVAFAGGSDWVDDGVDVFDGGEVHADHVDFDGGDHDGDGFVHL